MPPSERWKVFRTHWWGDEENAIIPCENQSAAEAIWHWKNAEEPGRWYIARDTWDNGNRQTLTYQLGTGGDRWKEHETTR
jgi:hypothetical protein